MVNHLEFHKYLSEKSELLNWLQNYCEQIRANVFKITPLSFFIKVDMSKPNALNTALAEFITVFNLFESSKTNLNKLI